MSVSAVTVNKGEAAEPVPCYGAEEAKAKAEERDEKAAVSALKASGSADVVAESVRKVFPFPKVVGRKYAAWVE